MCVASYRAGALSVGREDQLDGADAVVPGTRTRVQLAEGKVAIGDETEPTPALGGQFDDVLDIVTYAPTGESDTALSLHVLEDIHTIGIRKLIRQGFGRRIIEKISRRELLKTSTYREYERRIEEYAR